MCIVFMPLAFYDLQLCSKNSRVVHHLYQALDGIRRGGTMLASLQSFFHSGLSFNVIKSSPRCFPVQS